MFVTLLSTWAVGPSTVNVIVGLPLLSHLVGVDEHDQHRDQTYERHQHRRAQSGVDVWDEAPKSGHRYLSMFFILFGFFLQSSAGNTNPESNAWHFLLGPSFGCCDQAWNYGSFSQQHIIYMVFILEATSMQDHIREEVCFMFLCKTLVYQLKFRLCLIFVGLVH